MASVRRRPPASPRTHDGAGRLIAGRPPRGTGQHRDLLTEHPPHSVIDPPAPGPITVMPDAAEPFAGAVTAAGGSLVPLGPDTRGIVWVAYEQPELLDRALRDHSGIGWVQLPWAGVDAFSHVIAAHPERLWTSAKGAYSEPVAEQALGLAIALLRRYPQKALSDSWATPKTGTSLYGLDVVIVGAGGIAIELMRLLSVFEVRVTVVRRGAGDVPGAVRTVTSELLDEVIPSADVVVIAAASTSGTARMFGARQFALMKDSAVLVNIARGALVDSDALLDALRTGAIAGAGLDVTDPEPLPDGHPLWSEPACLITSHSADTPEMTAPLLAARIGANVRAFLGDGRFVGLVDPAAGY